MRIDGAALVFGCIVGIVFTLIGVGLGKVLNGPDLTHAIGVISRCGIYAVATVDSSGAVEVYDAVREAPAAVETLVNELPQDKRTAILVPCPAPVSDGTIPL